VGRFFSPDIFFHEAEGFLSLLFWYVLFSPILISQGYVDYAFSMMIADWLFSPIISLCRADVDFSAAGSRSASYFDDLCQAPLFYFRAFIFSDFRQLFSLYWCSLSLIISDDIFHFTAADAD